MSSQLHDATPNHNPNHKMKYKAISNDGGKTETFESFREAAEWLANSEDFQTVESGLGEYVYPADSEDDDNADCFGEVVELED